MAVGWTCTGEPSGFGEPGGPVTLVEGATLCISGRSGDVLTGVPHGLFFRDTRLLSTWRLLLDGQATETLSTVPREPLASSFVARARPMPGRADSTLLVLRHRYVGHGMREDIVLRNVGTLPVCSSCASQPTSPTCSRSRRAGCESTASGPRSATRASPSNGP